jgi:hypothetical protein
MMYKIRACKTCQTLFQPTGSTVAWCSNDCRFLSHIVGKFTKDECWEWDGAIFKGSGYGQFGSVKSGVFTAHRYSYQLFKGQIPDGMFVCHSCDNRKCFNPSHLWLGTPKDNVQDMVKKGRSKLGKKYPNASGENHWTKKKAKTNALKDIK